MSVRANVSFSLRCLEGLCSIVVSYVGLLVFSWGGGKLYFNDRLGFSALGGLVLMAEFPVYLLSIKLPRLSISLLWIVFASNLLIVTGSVWQYCRPGNCGAHTIWGAHDFWEVLWHSVTAGGIIPLTLIAAILAQTEYMVRRSCPSPKSHPADGPGPFGDRG
jgi:hypothetical protein